MNGEQKNIEQYKRERQSTRQAILEVCKAIKDDPETDDSTWGTEFSTWAGTTPLTELFEAAGLNQNNIAHWQIALVACAVCLFPEADYSLKGRPTEWTAEAEDRLIQFWLDGKRLPENNIRLRGLSKRPVGEVRVFQTIVDERGPFELIPGKAIDDAEVLRVRFQLIKAAAKAAVQAGEPRDLQTQLIEALAMGRGS